MAFDRHMNLVLGETEEFRKIRTKKGSGLSEEREEKRALGLIILRGDSVVSLTIDGPPPPEDNEKSLPGGPGIARLAAARGVPLPPPPMAAGAPVGLTGPVRGIGGPGIGIMQPPVQGIVHSSFLLDFFFLLFYSSLCLSLLFFYVSLLFFRCSSIRCFPSTRNATNAWYATSSRNGNDATRYGYDAGNARNSTASSKTWDDGSTWNARNASSYATTSKTLKLNLITNSFIFIFLCFFDLFFI
jgi:hypothetical protein